MPSKYTFGGGGDSYKKAPLKNRNRSRGNSDDGSLAYSAASSSNTSSTSNDFKNFDSQQLADLLGRHGIDTKSVAEDSMAYSHSDVESHARTTDSASHLQGTALVSAATSQQSEASLLGQNYLNMGGGQKEPDDMENNKNMFMMFRPAEHTDTVKRRKEKKRRERLQKIHRSPQRNTTTTTTTNNASDSTRARLGGAEGPRSVSRSPQHKKARPPKAPESPTTNALPSDDDDVWYAKWWMFCFGDLPNVSLGKRY